MKALPNTPTYRFLRKLSFAARVSGGITPWNGWTKGETVDQKMSARSATLSDSDLVGSSLLF